MSVMHDCSDLAITDEVWEGAQESMDRVSLEAHKGLYA